MDEGRARPRALIGRVGALALAGILAGTLATEAGAKPTRVKLSISTRTQSALLAGGRLEVRASSNARAKVKLRAGQGNRTGLFDGATIKLRRNGSKTAALRLKPSGRQRLGRCGAQRVIVKGTYRSNGRRVTASARRKLKPDPRRCRLHVDAPNVDRCDPIDLAACLAPYPNDYYTVADPTTSTGLRLNLDRESMTANAGGLRVDPTEANRNDGFSPNNTIVTRVPGIDTPEAFEANEIVPQMNIGAYDDPDQRVLLINAETGGRQPIWAELDMIPAEPSQRLLIIHPAVALDYGTRYIVALRNLTNAEGDPLQPNAVFRAYRDGRETDNAAVEERRPAMEELFDRLEAAAVERSELYLAWDFTVASEESLAGRLLAMRDDAFAQLGDTNLADGAVQGEAPPVNGLEQTPYQLCDFDGTPECEQQGASYPGYEGDQPTNGDVYLGPSQSGYAFKKVTGTITVPCYMNAPGVEYNPSDPNTPCATGSRLHYEAGAELPSQNGNVTWEAPFTCIIPRTGEAEATMATGNPGIVFGHGLLQSNTTTEALGLFPASLEGVACGTDWIGLSAIDSITGEILPGGDLTFLANMLVGKQDLSLFPALPDRSQQGYVNTLYLGRAMAHPEGFADEPEFQDAGGVSVLDIDPDDTFAGLGYYGVSLGGIFGGATTSVAPDWQRAVLSVPGMGFTTLLTRSTQFNQFLPLVFSAYPDALERQIGTSVLQLVWDRGEPSSYIHRLTDEPFPETPPHQVLMHEALGDHQVTNVQTETMARTLGAAVRTPIVAPGRLESIDYLFSDAVVPFWTPEQELLESPELNQPGGFDGSAALFTFDTGPIRTEGGQIVGSNPNLDWNIAPVDRSGSTPNDGLDPHEPVATSPAAQQSAIPFLLGQGIYDPCVNGAPGPTDMPPWTVPYTGTPSPCSAPPVHSLGQGQ
jgi:hypothetical protein